MKNNFMKFMFVIVLSMFIGITGVSAAETLQEKINAISETGTIELDKSYNEGITISREKDITIDLNDFTIQGKVIVYGSLTVKDSKGNGKITNNTNINVNGGVLTLESGNIDITGDYGTYVSNGGKAIVNGGTFIAKYAPLTGNNNSGLMRFEVNGGTVTAKVGPAIYAPGPDTIKVTGGTLNGGISVRMGNVEISGGTINAVTEGYGDPGLYYDVKANLLFPDALFVIGGTYTSSATGVTNELSLKITGGTFNCNNEIGSAVAIYDIGNLSQKMSVDISGDAVFKTISTKRNAFDVLSLTDLGVTEPKEGYGNPEYTGKVVTSVSGGTYSSIVKKDYIASGYAVKKSDDLYVVDVQEIEVAVPHIESQPKLTDGVVLGVDNSEEVKNILDSALKDSDINIEGIDPIIEFQVINEDEEDIDEDVITKIKDAITNEKKDIKVTNYFDISLEVINSVNDNVIGKITDLSEKIKLTLAIPEELSEIPSGYTRNFYIFKFHNGEIEVIKANYNTDAKTLDFESDGFSTYALGYEDVENPVVVNPQTGDNIILYVSMGIISLIGFVGASVYLKKKMN